MKVEIEQEDLRVLREVRTALDALLKKVEAAKTRGFVVEWDVADELYVRNIECRRDLTMEQLREAMGRGV